jgi:hypothetical protein
MADVIWKDEPEQHDFPAAGDYLSLLAPPDVVTAAVDALRAAGTVHRKAKDILRAAALDLLPVDNPHVASDLQKIAKKRPLAPVLLVRGDLREGRPLQIADGYHRVCASYHTDENTDIPCRIVVTAAVPDGAADRTAAGGAGGAGGSSADQAGRDG